MTKWMKDEELVATYRRMTKEGASASEIAKAVGTTRNSICGKWHRDGVKRERPISRVPLPVRMAQRERMAKARSRQSPLAKPGRKRVRGERRVRRALPVN